MTTEHFTQASGYNNNAAAAHSLQLHHSFYPETTRRIDGNTWITGPLYQPLVDAAQPVELKPEQLKIPVKHDDSKRDWSLLPMEAVEEIVKVLEFGAKKYAADNWREGSGFSWLRVANSLRRHLYAWLRGEDRDPETGLSHLAHAGCNVLFLLHYTQNKQRFKNDDRKKS